MSATPRETLKHIRIDVKNGWGFSVEYCPKCQDASLDILHADFCPAPAFDALLAVAKRAAAQWETDGCPFCATEADDTWHDEEHCPIGKLDAAHPNWRDWTP